MDAPMGNEEQEVMDSPIDNVRSCQNCLDGSCVDCQMETQQRKSKGKLGASSKNLGKVFEATESTPPGLKSEPAGSSDQASVQMLLEMRKITAMMGTLATKSDLEQLQDEISAMKQTTASKEDLQEALQPVKQEMVDLKTRQAKLEKMVNSTPATALPKELAEMRKLCNNLDPAIRSVAILGFKGKYLESNMAEARLKCVRDFMATNFPGQNINVANKYKGKWNERKLTPVTVVTFNDRDVAKSVLDRCGSMSPQIEGAELKVVWARTKFQEKRNWALRKAEEMIKGNIESTNGDVKIDMKGRKVTCDGEDAFVQGKEEPIGSFLEPFEKLSIKE